MAATFWDARSVGSWVLVFVTLLRMGGRRASGQVLRVTPAAATASSRPSAASCLSAQRDLVSLPRPGRLLLLTLIPAPLAPAAQARWAHLQFKSRGEYSGTGILSSTSPTGFSEARGVALGVPVLQPCRARPRSWRHRPCSLVWPGPGPTCLPCPWVAQCDPL